MRWLPPGILTIFTVFFSLAPQASALLVRGYSEAQHHRLTKFPGQPVFNQVPEVNPACIISAGLYLGIGWAAHPTDWTRHIALISPRHFVGAAHYPMGADWQIAFLGNDGAQHLYGIESQVPVLNAAGEATDLLLGTLSGEVDPAIVKPFKVLNLENEAAYQNQQMVVNGSFVHVGKMRLAGFISLLNDPDPYWWTTRYAYFDYDAGGGGADDCSYQGGDSGAPTFIVPAGETEPALIGTASAQDTGTANGQPLTANITRNYLNFIPAYLPQLDEMMEPSGYHIHRFYPTMTSLDSTVEPTAPLHRLKPGSVAIVIRNAGAAEADNVSVRLNFSEAPASVSGPGWICKAVSPSIWDCRRGGLSPANSGTLVASWSNFSAASGVHLTGGYSHDAAAQPANVDVTLPLAETYASWIQGAADAGQAADPDHDGISNLLEYAFGGAPTIAGPLAVAGHSQLPRLERSGDRLLVKYPRRTDAGARGLSDGIEFSETLAAGSWSSAWPAGATSRSEPFSPASEGFEQVTVSLPVDAIRRFVRVKVTLDE